MPTVVVVGVYWHKGQFGAWLDANVFANLVRIGGTGFSLRSWVGAVLRQADDHSLLWLSAAVAPLYIQTFFTSDAHRKAALWVTVAWWVAGLAGASATRSYYPHYFLQLLAPACILSACIVTDLVERGAKGIGEGGLPLMRRLIVLALVFSQAIVSAAWALARGAAAAGESLTAHSGQWLDHPAAVGKLIRAELDPGDVIYVVDAEPIIYHFAGAGWPTKFLFPPFLISRQFSTMAGVTGMEPVEELRAIMAHQPRFIIRRQPRKESGDFEALFEALERVIEHDYVPYASVDEVSPTEGHFRVDIYRRRIADLES